MAIAQDVNCTGKHAFLDKNGNAVEQYDLSVNLIHIKGSRYDVHMKHVMTYESDDPEVINKVFIKNADCKFNDMDSRLFLCDTDMDVAERMYLALELKTVLSMHFDENSEKQSSKEVALIVNYAQNPRSNSDFDIKVAGTANSYETVSYNCK